MTARSIAGGALVVAIVAAVIAIVASSGSDDRAHMHLVMPSSLGLREGSDVRVGGVSVGRVTKLGLTAADKVKIDMSVTDRSVRLGAGAAVTIKAQNLLGEKYVQLDPGTPVATPLTNVTIPASRVTSATDLDQVLDVLDADTSTRLGILVNELGIAVTGRSANFAQLLTKLPPSLDSATRLLSTVVSDNHTLADLIVHSDRFLGRQVASRKDLRAFIDKAAGAAETFAGSSDDLRSALAASPAALASLRGFLAKLNGAAKPLGPAARNISAAAPQLRSTLAQLAPFRAAAKPTLDEIRDVAPSLTRLGKEATPVIGRSLPTLSSLHSFANTATPLTKTLGHATPDLLGMLEGWGRTIQGRDGRGHMFHGGLTFGAGTLKTLLEPPGDGKSKQAKAPVKPVATAVGPQHKPDLAPVLADPIKKVAKVIGEIPGQVQDATKKLLGILGLDGVGQRRSGDRSDADTKSLLDYLLGS